MVTMRLFYHMWRLETTKYGNWRWLARVMSCFQGGVWLGMKIALEIVCGQ
jgi:hypothetical protein